MSEEHRAGTTPATAAPARRHMPLFFGIAKGGEPKRDQPGAPGTLSQMLALHFATQGTRVLVVDHDGSDQLDRWAGR
ncbi:hypothetical protein ACRWOO_02930 [Streptomyces sp. NEAU-PBA10]|uniref:AAA domain-containing protein n=1 Tax=Streptomyces tremellae TaxID=1124239 RepID=A0ABP7DYG0_9ACTN